MRQKTCYDFLHTDDFSPWTRFLIMKCCALVQRIRWFFPVSGKQDTSACSVLAADVYLFVQIQWVAWVARKYAIFLCILY